MNFKEGKIIDRFVVKKKGKQMEILIRFPRKNDAFAIWKYYNKAIRETTNLSRITPISLKEEKKWITNLLKDLKNKDGIYLFAEHDGSIVGTCTVNRCVRETNKHIADFGIAILQDYTGCGIGSRMIEHAIRLSKNILKVELLELSYHDDNKGAGNLYRKFGFVVAGKIPRAIKHGRKYMDRIIMYKILR